MRVKINSVSNVLSICSEPSIQFIQLRANFLTTSFLPISPLNNGFTHSLYLVLLLTIQVCMVPVIPNVKFQSLLTRVYNSNDSMSIKPDIRLVFYSKIVHTHHSIESKPRI